MTRRAFLAGTSATLALLTVWAPAAAQPRTRGEVRRTDVATDLALRTRSPWYSPLTPREAQIVVLVTAGLTTRQIASRPGMTPWTTDHRVSWILQKLDVGRRAQIRDWVIKQQQER